jgi:ABC-type dipeptide/oligopeptide/nickel transport system ATPase component
MTQNDEMLGQTTAKDEVAEATQTEGVSASMADSDTVKKESAAGYSGTNLQVQGVDESDIVKTDGHYIYIADDKEVRIVDVSTGTMRQLGSIQPKLSGNLDRILEMYLADDKLCLIVQTENSEIDVSADTGASSISVIEDVAWYDTSGIQTKLLTYDVTAPAGAKLLGTVTMDGSYDSSRKIGDMVYLFSDYAVSSRRISEQCVEACRLACADEFIERFPEQYDTYLEQGGSNLSGGQKQRLCIARALLKNPKILILDDSTSAVDTATDAKIRRAFAEKIPGTTKLIIAQRISSVQQADRIIVMEDGQILGFDTHEALLENNEIYRDIYESQTKGGGDFDEKAGEM